ncbi:UNVERIFIED_CONTAM: hypothetical protein PYX00_000033 [Menopon gallinae]|uniref:Uncharacterized protein n=1 Tax=Menopon gallinae TaxID=328185 RepID=A0AAW2I7E7_9NEOP
MSIFGISRKLQINRLTEAPLGNDNRLRVRSDDPGMAPVLDEDDEVLLEDLREGEAFHGSPVGAVLFHVPTVSLLVPHDFPVDHQMVLDVFPVLAEEGDRFQPQGHVVLLRAEQVQADGSEQAVAVADNGKLFEHVFHFAFLVVCFLQFVNISFPKCIFSGFSNSLLEGAVFVLFYKEYGSLPQLSSTSSATASLSVSLDMNL